VMIIPPASPNRIMCRHRRAWCCLCRRSAFCCGSATLIGLLADCSVSGGMPGEFAADCITKGYTTERADSTEVSSLSTERELSSLPTGCVSLQPCGDLKTSPLCDTWRCIGLICLERPIVWTKLNEGRCPKAELAQWQYFGSCPSGTSRMTPKSMQLAV
jgi:hypothetical protein